MRNFDAPLVSCASICISTRKMGGGFSMSPRADQRARNARRARGARFGSSRGRLGACRHGTCGPPPGLPLHRPVHMGRLGSGHAPVGRCSAVHGNSQAHGGRGEQNGPKMRFRENFQNRPSNFPCVLGTLKGVQNAPEHHHNTSISISNLQKRVLGPFCSPQPPWAWASP